MVNPIHLPLAIKHLIDKYTNSAEADRKEALKYNKEYDEAYWSFSELADEKEEFVKDLKDLIQ